MTTFPGSPRVLKGALVAYNFPDPTPRVIVFQYNPTTLTRSLEAQTAGEGDRAFGPLRLVGAPQQTFDLGDVEIDAAIQFHEGDPEVLQSGIRPQLAALETLLYPSSTHVITNLARLALGSIEIVPALAPFTLFVFGQRRVLPVELTSLTITEELFDPDLNPIRAKVSMSLRVLSYNDLPPEHPGHALFLTHQIAKETMARVTRSLDAVARGIANLL
jgi:hypothetical protein